MGGRKCIALRVGRYEIDILRWGIGQHPYLLWSNPMQIDRRSEQHCRHCKPWRIDQFGRLALGWQSSVDGDLFERTCSVERVAFGWQSNQRHHQVKSCPVYSCFILFCCSVCGPGHWHMSFFLTLNVSVAICPPSPTPTPHPQQSGYSRSIAWLAFGVQSNYKCSAFATFASIEPSVSHQQSNYWHCLLAQLGKPSIAQHHEQSHHQHHGHGIVGGFE